MVSLHFFLQKYVLCSCKLAYCQNRSSKTQEVIQAYWKLLLVICWVEMLWDNGVWKHCKTLYGLHHPVRNCYYEQSKLKGTQAIFMPSVLTSVYKPFESTRNGVIGQTTEHVLPAHTEAKGDARR